MRRALLLLALAGCATSVEHLAAPPVDHAPDAGLPEDRGALFAIADAEARDGPGGPDLERSYAAAAKVLKGAPHDGEALWRATRALYYQTRARLTPEGAARCMQFGALAAEHGAGAEGPFFHALCMGARAQAVNSEGLDLIKKMIAAAEAAKAKDAALLHGGPDRLLGGIYLHAPSWPTSVGDTEKAIEHLEAASRLGPEWPENFALLAAAYLAEDREDDALDAVARARATLDRPEARGWRSEIAERLAKVEEKLGP